MADGLDKYLDKFAPKKPKAAGDDSVARVLDDEFAKLGYGDTARLSILGDVGRENAWNRQTIFGGHNDPKNNARNRGIISWQGDRSKKLDDHLKKEGVYGRGDDEELRGMARFMDSELKTDFPDVRKSLMNARGTYDASEALRKYIKYVPNAPYNTPDDEFRVKNNADWAKRAKSLGLAQKGLDDYLDRMKGGTSKDPLDAYLDQIGGQPTPTNPTQQPLTTGLKPLLQPGQPLAPETAEMPITVPDQLPVTSPVTNQPKQALPTAKTPILSNIRKPQAPVQSEYTPSVDSYIPPTAPPIEPDDNSSRVIADDFKRPVSFREKPADVPSREWVVQQLVPEIVAKTGYEAIDVEKQLRQGFQNEYGTPLDKIGPDGTWTFEMTPDFADAVVARGEGKRNALANVIATGQDLTDEDKEKLSKSLGLDPAEIDTALAGQGGWRYQDAVTQGAANKQFYAAKQAEYAASLDANEPPTVAQIKAAADVGWLTKAEADKALAKEKEAFNEIVGGDRNDRRMIRGAFQTQGMDVKSGDDTEAINSIIQRYGTLANYKAEKDALAEKYKYRPLAEPLEFAKRFGNAVPQAVSSILETIAIAGEMSTVIPTGAVDHFAGTDLQKQLSAENSPLYKIGKDFGAYFDDLKNKDFDDNKLISIVPDTLGQIVVQILAGVASGGATVPTALGAAMGASQQYEDAAKFTQDPTARLVAASVGAAAAIPDAIIFNQWFKGLGQGETQGFLNNFAKSMYSRLGMQFGDAAAEEMTRVTMKTWANNLIKGSLFEGAQEVSENKINDALALAVYDRSEARKKKLLSINQEDIASFIGGLVGGFGGGVVETRIEQVNEQKIEDALTYLPDLVAAGKITAAQAAAAEPILQEELQQRKKGSPRVREVVQLQPIEGPKVNQEPAKASLTPESKPADSLDTYIDQIKEQTVEETSSEVPAQPTQMGEKPLVSDTVPENTIKTATGDLGKGAAENLKQYLWEKVQNGETDELGEQSTILTIADKIRKAGGLQTKEDFDRYTQEFGKTAANQKGKDLVDAANDLYKQFVPRKPVSAPVTDKTATDDSPSANAAEVPQDAIAAESSPEKPTAQPKAAEPTKPRPPITVKRLQLTARVPQEKIALTEEAAKDETFEPSEQQQAAGQKLFELFQAQEAEPDNKTARDKFNRALSKASVGETLAFEGLRNAPKADTSNNTELATQKVAPLGLPDDLASRVINRLTAAVERDGGPVSEVTPELLRHVIVKDLDGYRRNDLQEVLKPFIEQVDADNFDVMKNGGKVWNQAQQAIQESDDRHDKKNYNPGKEMASAINMDAITPENIDQIAAMFDKPKKAEAEPESKDVYKSIEEAPDYGVYSKYYPSDGTTWYGFKDPNGAADGKGNRLTFSVDEARADADKARQSAERSKQAETEQAMLKPANAFTEAMSPMQRGKAEKALSKVWNVNGKHLTTKEYVDQKFKDGTLELDSYEENRIKDMTRRQYNRATNEQQAAHEKKVREGGKVTKYLVNGLELGKTAYDYAQHLSASVEADPENRPLKGRKYLDKKSGAAIWVVDPNSKQNNGGITYSHRGPDATDSEATGVISVEAFNRRYEEEGAATTPTIKEIADASPNISIVRPDTKAKSEEVIPHDGWRGNLIKSRDYANRLGIRDQIKKSATVGEELENLTTAIDDYLSLKGHIRSSLQPSNEVEKEATPKKSTADLFKEKLEKLKKEQEATKPPEDDDGWGDLDSALGLKSVLETQPEFDEAKYKDTFTPIFKKIVSKFDTTDPGEQMETFLRKMNERYPLDIIAGLEPYVVKFFDENVLQSEADKSTTPVEAENNADRENTIEDGRDSDGGESPADVQGTDSGREPRPSDQGTDGSRDGDVSADAQSGDGEVVDSKQPSTKGTKGNKSDQSGDRDSDSTSNGLPDGRTDSNGRDYIAPVGGLTREGSWRDAARTNLDIIELVKTLENEDRLATPEEQQLLVKYTGWGASELSQNIFSHYPRQGWEDLHKRIRELLTDEEMRTAQRSTQYAHYTSEKIIRGIWNAFQQFGFKEGRILEPGMGVGLFASAAPKSVIEKSRYTGIEMDHMTARIAKQILQRQTVLEADYVKQKLPDNFFDVAIGNPPFGDITILDDPKYKKYRFKIHDYFFAKSIDKVRPGGVLVFVTSKGTMDKGDTKMREYISERADMLGAIRLPQTAFKQNAGTEVVTDVLFFRKRLPGETPAGQDWINRANVTAKNSDDENFTGLVNEYFVNNPDMVLGEHSFTGSMRHGNNEYTVTPRDGDIEEHFAKAIKNLPSAVYADIAKADEIAEKVAERDWNPKAKKEGSLYIHDDGRLMRRDDGSGVAIVAREKISANDEKWLRSYTGLRDALKQAQYDQLKEGDWEKSLAALNKVYDAFVKKHGPILAYSDTERVSTDAEGRETVKVTRRFKNNKLLSYDVESPLVFALERINEDGKIVKSKTLTERQIKPPQPPVIRTLSDALAVSLDRTGALNLKHVEELIRPVREMTEAEIVAELGDSIYEDPSGGWQMADEYLSGYVKQKLAEAEAAAKIDKKFQRNVEALIKAQPAPLLPANIQVGLGSPWVSAEYITQFAQEELEFGRYNDVSFNALSNTFTVQGASGSGSQSNRDAAATWGTADRSPQELLEAALNNKVVKIYRTTGSGATRTPELDKDASASANDIIKKMRESFKRWVWADADRARDLAGIYNEVYNNIAERQFNGDHLTLPGLSAVYKLHPHQARVVWRILQTGNTYLAHAVGAGKTLEMIVSAMEQKRLGLISKPMFAVPNHMLKQFASEFLDAYPMANIMVADEQNFHKDNRRRFVAQAALNDLDAVIVTHSAFGLLRARPETGKAVVDDLIEQMQMAIVELTDERGNPVDRNAGRTIKQLEKRIEQIERRFGGFTNDEKRDNVVDFEDLGVDFLYIDEAHEFRKLDFVTNRENTKGIDANGSQRALDLLIKARYLNTQRPGRALVLASGTPVTNTLAELYSIQRYMDPQELEESGISHFDAWASQFGEAAADYEMNAAGNYELVERFSKFVNIPELMKRVRKFMDVLSLRQLGDLVDLPAIKGGQAEIVINPASEETSSYLKNELAARIKTSREWKPSPGQPGNPDPLINIITDGRLAAIDMRYVKRGAPNDPNSKLNQMIDKIIEKHFEYKDLEYTAKDTGKAEPVKGAAQIVFSAVGFGAQVAANRGFDAKGWMLERFTKAGIDPKEVAFMSDYKTNASKEAMFKEMRQGTKRILIGSPKNMGTGVNVQKRLKVLHFLSPPWYPADVEQPDGRQIRQGNQNEDVENYRYATKGTYDATAWQMVARKSRSIEQAMTGDDSQRTLEDISESSQYEMASALAAGDERAIRLAGLRGDIERLERLKGGHRQEQQQLDYDLRRARSEAESDRKHLKRVDAALALVGDYVSSEDFNVTVDGATLGRSKALGDKSRADIGEVIKPAWEQAFEKAMPLLESGVTNSREIGKVQGKFPLIVQTFKNHRGDFSTRLMLETGDIQHNVSSWLYHPGMKIEGEDSTGLATRIYNALNNLSKMKSDDEESIRKSERQTKQIQSKLGQPFADEQELFEKIAEFTQLQAEMASDGAEVPENMTAEEISQLLLIADSREGGEPGRIDALGNDERTAVDEAYQLAKLQRPLKSVLARQNQTETPAFKKWFKDSKVVDENGEPLVVYHGTNRDFDVFEMGKGGSVHDTSDSENLMWFSSSIRRANEGAKDAAEMFADTDADYEAQTGANVKPVYLRLLNPYILEWTGDYMDNPEFAKLARRVRKQGYDGIVRRGEMGGQDYAVFDPTSIKSAIGNNGNFDENEPSILKSVLAVEPSQNPFYSQLERTIEAKMPAKASADQVRGIIKDTKAEEREWLGIDEFLDSKPSFTKDEVLAFVRENNVDVQEVVKGDLAATNGFTIDEGTPKDWHVYEGDGFVGTVPKATAKNEDEALRLALLWYEQNGEEVVPTKYSSYTLPGGENYRELLITMPPQGGVYARGEFFKSGHFDEPNILAHLRFDERTVDGKKTLHIAEIQSDWSQAQRQGKDVPKTPFGKTDSWAGLAFKKALRYAVENDFDAVSWDVGATQAGRYDLSKHISEIHYSGSNLKAYGLNGETVMERTGVKEDDLPDIIGKDATQRLLDQEPKGSLRSLVGEDLKVGGEGMSGFYDKILPAFVNKYVRKWGGKVERGSVIGGDASGIEVDDYFVDTDLDSDPFDENPTYTVYHEGGEEIASGFETAEAAQIYIRSGLGDYKSIPVHSLTITPDMKASVLAGQPLFAKLDAADENEQMTVEQMKDLPYEPIETILAGAEMERRGDLLKMNAKSHELMRRAFEEKRWRDAQAQGKTLKPSDYEDLFGGVFLEPQVVQNTLAVLRDKATEAKELGYTPEEVATFTDHADMLEAAAKEGNGTAVMFILDRNLPGELFHQADYLGAAEKTLLDRHDGKAKTALDAHKVKEILWNKHYSRYNEYKRFRSQKALNAVLRAEIPTYLIESSDESLEAMGITPEMVDDYLLTWLEGYAAKNGVDSLDNFDKEEFDVQDFIKQIKEAYRQQSMGQGSQSGDAGGGQQKTRTQGETRGSPVSTDGSQKAPQAESGTDRRYASRLGDGLTDGVRLTEETHFGRRIEKRQIEKEMGLGADERLRSLPLTLRRAGIDAIDLAYEVFKDGPAIEAATALLEEHGVNGSVELLRNLPAKALDAEHGILSFMLMRTLQDHAASLRETNPEEAKKAFELSLELGREHAIAATQLGRFTRVPSIIGGAVENLMYAVQGIIEERSSGKTLSAEQWERVEGIGRDLEAAIAKINALQKENRNKQAQIKRLKDKEAGKKPKRSKSTVTRKTIVKLIEADTEKSSAAEDGKARMKAKWLGGGPLKSVLSLENGDAIADYIESQSTDYVDREMMGEFFRGARAVLQDVPVASINEGPSASNMRSAKKESAYAKLNSSAPPIVIENNTVIDGNHRFRVARNRGDKTISAYVVETIENAPLKSVLPEDDRLDAEDLNDFANVGAMMLIEGLAGETEYLPSDFKAELLSEFGSGVEPYFDEIYKAAWDRRTEWLNDLRYQQTKERVQNKYAEGEDLEDWEIEEILGTEKMKAKRRRFIERYHEITVGAKKPKKNLGAYKAIIADLTKDESDAVALGALVHAEGLGPAEMYKRLIALGVTDEAEQRNAIRKGADIWQKAKLVFRDQQEEVANEILEAEGEQKKIDELLWQAREDLRKSQAAVVDEMRRIKNGEGWYRLSQLSNILNMSRTLMASFDMSGALRQGGFFTIASPENQKKAIVNMWKSIREKGYGAAVMEIERGGNFTLSQRSGLDYAIAGKTDESSLLGEELFKSDKTIEAIPVIGKLLSEGVVKWSERTYTAFLDTQRYVMFDAFAKELMSRVDKETGKNLTFRSHPDEFKKIAKFVNIATGRGTVPANKWGEILMNLPLFAPRYTMSRLQLLNMTLNPVAYANMPPAARKIVAKNAVRFYGTTMGVLGLVSMFGAAIGASVNWDDDDDDFLKIKIGSSKYDIFAGTLQPAKLIIRVVHSAIRTKLGQDNRLPREFWDDSTDAGLRYLRGKLSPTAGLIWDALSGSDYNGNETQFVSRKFGFPMPGRAIYSRLMPLTFNEIYESYSADGVVGIARAVPPSFLGVGVSTYKERPERPETEAEKFAAKAAAWQFQNDKPQTDEEKRKRDAVQSFRSRSRAGEDIAEELKLAVKDGTITKRQQQDILSAATESYLVDKAEGLSIENMETVYRLATPAERIELLPILSKKMKNASIDGKLTSEQRGRLESLGAKVAGEVPMPDTVKQEFDQFNIPIPDVGENLTLQKGGAKTRLSPEQYDKYRKETLTRIYAGVEEIIRDPSYRNASDADKERILRKVISKQRAKEQKETKGELLR